MSENIIQIVTAEQARENIEKAKKEQYESHLSEIIHEIKDAIERSILEFEYSCIIDNHTFAFNLPIYVIYENIHQILEGLGYRVKYLSEYDFMSIDWSKIR